MRHTQHVAVVRRALSQHARNGVAVAQGNAKFAALARNQRHPVQIHVQARHQLQRVHVARLESGKRSNLRQLHAKRSWERTRAHCTAPVVAAEQHHVVRCVVSRQSRRQLAKEQAAAVVRIHSAFRCKRPRQVSHDLVRTPEGGKEGGKWKEGRGCQCTLMCNVLHTKAHACV